MMIESKRLRLRQCQLSDDSFVMELYNQAEFIEFIGDKGLTTLQDAQNYLKHNLIKSYQTFGFGLYVMEVKASGEIIGVCGLVKRDCLNEPDLGYALLNDYTGKGYALEAAKAVLDYCQHQLKLDSLYALIKPDNIRSMQLLTKLDFKPINLSAVTNELQETQGFHLNLC